MRVRRYSDHPDRAAARRRSKRILRDQSSARGGDWRPAGVSADGFEYPEGEWPGAPVGGGRPCRPEICIATHSSEVRRGRGRLADRFLVLDDDGAPVDEDTEIERPTIDDAPEPVTR